MTSTTFNITQHTFSTNLRSQMRKPVPDKELPCEDFFAMESQKQRLTFLMDRLRMKHSELAELMGRSVSAVNKWVNTNKFPRDSVAEMAAALQVDRSELVVYLTQGGPPPELLRKTSVKSEQPSIVERQSSGRAVNGAGQRLTASVPPIGSEWRAMWDDYQAALAHCGQLSIRNQRLEDEVANLQETIRAMKAAAAPARLKATPKPAAVMNPTDTHIIDRIVTPEVLAPGVSRKSPNQTPPAKRSAKAG